DLTITDPATMERSLNNLAGVVTNGLFAIRAADLLLVSSEGEVRERSK
ncbi:MAG: ribose 5-phosphate isomerase A, partial [Candidatus Azotimanducaceae bacterium]